MPVKIFFCYAHEDEELLNKLKKHLRPLQRQGLIEVWHDRDISAGTKWEEEIDKHLNEANIILLLISPDFMDSDYCYSIEMQRALERYQKGEARVVPIILRPTYWHGLFGNLQALPTDAKPVLSSSWQYQDEAFFNVVEGVRKAAEELSVIDIIANPQTWSQQKPRGLLIFLLDQSNAMEESFELSGFKLTLAKAGTSILNDLLVTTIAIAQRNSSTGRIENYSDIAIFGYSDQVKPLLNPDGRPVPLPYLAENSRGKQTVRYQRFDVIKSEYVQTDEEQPFWIEPYTNNQPSKFILALNKTYQVIQNWLNVDNHTKQGFPPVVINITSGIFDENFNEKLMQKVNLLQELSTDSGKVLLFNCYINKFSSQNLTYPKSVEQIKNLELPEKEKFIAEQLFEISSVMPSSMIDRGRMLTSASIPSGARGFIYNRAGDPLIRFLTWSSGK